MFCKNLVKIQNLRNLNRRKILIKREYIPNLIPWTSDGYLTDKRKKGERESCVGYNKTLKDGRLIRFEIADEFDLVLIAQQMNDGFVREVNICKALNATFDDFAFMHFDMIRNCLPFRGTILGFHEDKLVCFRIVRYIRYEDFEEFFGPQRLPGKHPQFIIKSDYAEDVAKIPLPNLKSRILANFLLACESQINQFIPKRTNKIAFGEAVFVHDHFKNHDLGKIISHASEKLAHSHGCEYIGSIAVARKSSQIAFKKTFHRLFSFPYNKYIVNGQIVFKDLVDGGATEANVFLGKL